VAGRSASDQLPAVSVVIPTRNGRKRLAACIEAVRAAGPAEIVTVVDGADPETLDVLDRLRARDPRVVAVSVPQGGPAAARAAGARRARGEVVLFLDDDVVAGPGLVEGHARHHGARTGIVVVGYMPLHLGVERRRGQFAARVYAEEYERMCAIYEREPEQILLSLWGGNFSLRRSDCERVGVASPAFALRYHEDREFGVRCHKAGLVGVFDRTLLAEHRHSTDAATFAADARVQGAGRLLVHRLHEDVLGPLDVNAFSAELPPFAGTLVRLTRGPRSHAIAASLLRRAGAASGLLRLFALEALLARLLRRVERQHGALELARGRGA
jgi:glycosyltransferase involved in cell wall biosynthesis